MKIDKNIPVPKRHRATSESGKLVEQMEQGSSVLFSEEQKADSLRVAGTNRGYRMSIYRRTQDEDGETGWRVWLMDKNWKPKRKKPARAAAPVIPLIGPRAIEK